MPKTCPNAPAFGEPWRRGRGCGGPGLLARLIWHQVSRAEVAEPSARGRFQNGEHSPHSLPTTWLAILPSGRSAVRGRLWPGGLRGTPVLMLGLLENSRPRGQRTGGNPSRGLHCKAKGVPHGPGSPLRAPQGVNDGRLPHSQAAIQLVTAVFKYASSSFW